MSSISEFFRAIRLAPRSLWRTRAISIASITTLGMAIGATTAIFSVLYAVVLRPLPFEDPDQIVQINARAEDGRLLGISQVEFEDWLEQAPAFTSLALHGFNQFTLTGAGDPALLRGAIVSTQFFSLLGTPMRLGRGLDDGDDLAAHVVLSESLWRQQFGGDASIVGRAVTLNGEPHTVIGVAPAKFRFPAEDVSVWTGLGKARTTAPPQWKMRGFRQFSLIGRVRDARAMSDVEAQADQLAASLARTYPRFNDKIGAVITPLSERMVGSVRSGLLMLFAAVTLVLLVACANLANLSFARASTRRRELAIRSAAGASRGQLVAGSLAESTVLGALGGGLGLVVAVGATAAVLRFIPPDAPRAVEIQIDSVSLAFTLAISVSSVILFGLWPAWWAARQPTHSALRDVRHAPAGSGVFRDGLVVSEIALAVVLLVGSALLGRSLYNLLQNDTGARHSDAITMKLNLSPIAGTATAQSAMTDRLLAQLAMTSAVRDAGIASSLPPSISQMRTSVNSIDGNGAETELSVEIVAASGGVFSALGVPLLAGRTFTGVDTAQSPQVVILSKLTSDRFFPQGDPIGREFAALSSDPSTPPAIVVGVVGDVKYGGLEAPPAGAIYVPHTQRNFRTQYLVVRAADGPALTTTIRGIISTIEPSLAISDIRSLRDLTTTATARPRFQAAILILFAALALALATIGLYGVTTHVVGQRTAELAIRIALGATPPDILKMILNKALLLSVLGATIGVALSFAAARGIESLLYGVRPLDWPSFAVSALFTIGVGSIAALGPALRATRVDPSDSLRAG